MKTICGHGRMMDATEVAVELGVSRNRVYQMFSEKKLPHVRVGRLLMVPRAAWDQWFQDQANSAMASVVREETAPCSA